MTPNDLDQYLLVFKRHSVGSAALKLPDGTELHCTFMPIFAPQIGSNPTPGGWKSPQHLDNPDDLREIGDLPS